MINMETVRDLGYKVDQKAVFSAFFALAIGIGFAILCLLSLLGLVSQIVRAETGVILWSFIALLICGLFAAMGFIAFRTNLWPARFGLESAAWLEAEQLSAVELTCEDDPIYQDMLKDASMSELIGIIKVVDRSTYPNRFALAFREINQRLSHLQNG